MKAALAERPVTRRLLGFLVCFQLGLMTFSAAQYIHSADLTPGSRTVTFVNPAR